MIIDVLYVATSLIAIVGMLAMALGYRRSLFVGDKVTKWFAWSLLLLSGSFVLRRAILDLYALAHPEILVHRQLINLAVNLIAIAAAYAGLRARWLLIPEPDRQDWHWYSAWTHPGLFGVQPKARTNYHQYDRDEYD